MRLPLLAAFSLAMMAPVALHAQTSAPDEAPVAEPVAPLAEKLADPAEQERMAGMLAAMGNVLLDMRVGPLLEVAGQWAPDGAAPVADPDATMRDLAGPGADRMPAEVADKLPRLMAALAGMMHQADAMRPLLDDMAHRMKDQVDGAMAQ